ncbi:MAG TPA: family 78 glycoside hydrolase catalytic domain, partial [Tepidisphaeraceae bacterium]|nr:family 78 glycoside hydrolase catalytic domain [Tepidisphaeraceae bacterium]
MRIETSERSQKSEARSQKVRGIGFLLILATGFWLLASVRCVAQQLTPVDLTVDYQTNPLGISDALPRFGWLLKSNEPDVRGQTQSAYEIRVASSLAKLKSGHADLWKSGKTLGDATTHIEYAGEPPLSGQQCWWQVRVWNRDNIPGQWSAPATWSMGLLTRADWKAQWIGLDARSLGQFPPMNLVGCQWIWTNQQTNTGQSTTRYFRGHFTVPKDRKIRNAILGMTASDGFTAWVNGHRILAGKNRQVLFTRDVGFALHAGQNIIAVQVENSGDHPALAGRLNVCFTKGSPMRFDVGTTWKCAETAPANWQQAKFEDLSWNSVEPLGPVGRQPWGQPTQVNLPSDPAVYLRQSFLLERKVTRATLYVTALGGYEFHLNGHPVAQDRMLPGYSDYRSRVYYQTYDVTKQLHLGHNALGIILTDGWYAGYWPQTGRTHNYGGEPRAMAQLEIDFSDGTSEAVVTDKSWHATFGPLSQADPIRGEIYDARNELHDWDQPLYNTADWTSPKVGLSVPEPRIEADPGPAACAQQVLSPRSIREEIPGQYIADFGREIAGHIRLHARATAGQTIELNFADKLNRDGSLDEKLPAGRTTDIYIPADCDSFTFEPEFSDHRFRYVAIAGLSEPPAPDQILAVAVAPKLDRTGWFSSANHKFDERYEHILWERQNHWLDEPAEQFEFGSAAAYTENVARLYHRLLETLSDESRIAEGGVITSSSPLDHHPNVRAGWQDAEPMVLWDLLRIYDDRRIVRRHWAELAAYMKDLKANWQKYAHSDRLFRDNGNEDESEMIALGYTAHVADMMSEMAAELNNQTDAEDYRRTAAELTHQFQDKYLNIQSDKSIHSQAGYALAIRWGLIPADSRAEMANQLVRQLRDDQWKVSAGPLGRSQILFALSDAGRSDTAYRLLTKRSFIDPSAARWLYQDAAGI